MARLPILMYHSVSESSDSAEGLTISAKLLEAHFKFLHDNGYESFHFSELKRGNTHMKLPKKSIVITFDDVYVNQLEFAYPLLQKYNLKASFFIPFAYVNGFDSWNTNSEAIMSLAQLQSLDPNVIELGLHSFNHNRYDQLNVQEIEDDFHQCNSFIQDNNLKVNHILAYPYGKYPKSKDSQSEFFKILESNQISYGLRIGNRVNTFPFKNNFKVERIDIKGEDTLSKFKLKLRFGKLKLF